MNKQFPPHLSQFISVTKRVNAILLTNIIHHICYKIHSKIKTNNDYFVNLIHGSLQPLSVPKTHTLQVSHSVWCFHNTIWYDLYPKIKFQCFYQKCITKTKDKSPQLKNSTLEEIWEPRTNLLHYRIQCLRRHEKTNTNQKRNNRS